MRQTRGSVWRERTYPTQWWRRPFVRTIASVNLNAPDGRTFEVRVTRLLWPPRGGVGIDTGSVIDAFGIFPVLAGSRNIWGVRVCTGTGPRLFRALVYGEEHRERSDALERSHAIADGIKQGKQPSDVE